MFVNCSFSAISRICAVMQYADTVHKTVEVNFVVDSITQYTGSHQHGMWTVQSITIEQWL